MSWRSKDQTVIASSSTEAEYVSLELASREALALRGILAELRMSDGEIVVILEDNKSTIQLVENAIYSERTKHIDVKYHAVRDRMKKGMIAVKYCEGTKMTADMLTKPLAFILFARHSKGLGLC